MKPVVFAAMTLVLAACASLGLTGNPATDLAKVQPIESAVACEAQRIANQTTVVGIATADPQLAAGSQLASLVAGTFCNGLAAGAPLPSPIPVAGTTVVQTASGPVTLPVPTVPKS